MNSKATNFLKNFSYTLSSNLVSLIISTLVILVIPKLIGAESYGYWQLFLFYSSYVGFLHFGWNDGIYLRYGGYNYEKLNKGLFFSQFIMLIILQMIIAIFIIIFSYLFIVNPERLFIVRMTTIAMVIVNSRYMLLFILQATNKIQEYARITILDRLVYIFLIILVLLVGLRDYKLIIIADLVGKFLSFIYAMYICREIVNKKISSFYISLQETYLNITVGIKLMFSSIASKLVIGIVKLGIERSWNIETFGKVSLTLSVSNLVMLFINAVGVVIYPVLRRTDKKKYPEIYIIMRDFLMCVLLGVLITYYPLKNLLSYWLPDYAESLKYMGILFPIVIYESKMSLLINTYLKVLRKEKIILVVNVTTVIFSLFFTILSTYVLKDLELTIFFITLLLAFRGIAAEMFLSKYLNIKVKKDIFLEIIMTMIFIYSSWIINSRMTVFIYAIFYLVYLVIKKSDLIDSYKKLKKILLS